MNALGRFRLMRIKLINPLLTIGLNQFRPNPLGHRRPLRLPGGQAMHRRDYFLVRIIWRQFPYRIMNTDKGRSRFGWMRCHEIHLLFTRRGV